MYRDDCYHIFLSLSFLTIFGKMELMQFPRIGLSGEDGKQTASEWSEEQRELMFY